MRTLFKVFGLEESTFTKDAWLSIEGVKTETQMITVRIHLADFNDELSAIEWCKSQKGFEHGFEIVKVLVHE